MAIISRERTFTWEKLKRITSLDIANLFLIITMILPFFLFKRAAPQTGFYSELTGVICVALFLIPACFSVKKFLITNRLTIYIIVISSYLIFDIFINSPIYSSLQWLYIGSLLLSSLVAITITSLCHQQGYKKIFVVACYGLMIGALLQDAVVILQTLHQDWTGGWINHIDAGQAYSGNIGQRNLLAHYLSWGILSTAYLVYQKNLGRITGWLLIIFQTAILGAVNSQTLIVYMLTILILLVITRIRQKELAISIFKTLTLTLIFVFAFQMITLPIINIFQDISSNNISSFSRLTNSPDYTSRLVEWHKAWVIFLENPWFGTGWNSYGYQGFMISLNPNFASSITGNSVFSHTHNIVFNLLAETGIVGTTIILGGFTYLLKPLLVNKWQVETIVILSMITVTAVHSLLEFPLWYAHFFLVFTILLSVLLSINQPNKTQKEETRLIHYGTKIFISISSLFYLFIAVQLYVLYWQMEQYKFDLDNSEQNRIFLAEKTIIIGKNQPLMSAYSDAQAFNSLIGISADKIPNRLNQSLYNSTHYLPHSIVGIYYLIKQCDGMGRWSVDNWLYYDQLNNYYKNMLPTYSILLSMTISCDQVYDIVNQECKDYFKQKGKSPVCSIDQSISKLNKL